MSEKKVEVVLAAYAALRRADVDGFLAVIDPEVEFVSLVIEADSGQTYRGQ